MNITEIFKKYHAIGRADELKIICFHNQIRYATQNGLKNIFLNMDLKTMNALGDYLKPDNIEITLEISEAEALHNVDHHLAQKWRHQGFKIAIDDFGAGFLSLPFLAQLRPDYIKLDRSTLVQACDNETFFLFFKRVYKNTTNLYD